LGNHINELIMAEITLKGSPIQTNGNLPATGTAMADFKLVGADLSEVGLDKFEGKKKVLNIFPSVDTGTCATSVRTFNQKASDLDNTVVLCISRDLPFAQSRFCGAEGIENVHMLSDFVDGHFGKNNGLEITTGPLKGLHSRCIIVLDEANKVVYTEQVAETVNEPDYEAAIQHLG